MCLKIHLTIHLEIHNLSNPFKKEKQDQFQDELSGRIKSRIILRAQHLFFGLGLKKVSMWYSPPGFPHYGPRQEPATKFPQPYSVRFSSMILVLKKKKQLYYQFSYIFYFTRIRLIYSLWQPQQLSWQSICLVSGIPGWPIICIIHL